MKKLLLLLVILLMTACAKTTPELGEPAIPEGYDSEVAPQTEPVEVVETPKVASWEDGIIAYTSQRIFAAKYTERNNADHEAYITSEIMRFIPLDRSSDEAIAFLKAFPDKENSQLFAQECYYGGEWQDFTYGTVNTIHTIIEFVDKADSQHLLLNDYFAIASEDEPIDFNDTYSGHYTFDIDYSEGNDWSWPMIADKRSTGVALFLEPDYNMKDLRVLRNTSKGVGVRIRTSPEIRDDNVIGKTEDVFECYVIGEDYNDGRYTWYQLGPHRWVADDGTWFNVYHLSS